MGKFRPQPSSFVRPVSSLSWRGAATRLWLACELPQYLQGHVEIRAREEWLRDGRLRVNVEWTGSVPCACPGTFWRPGTDRAKFLLTSQVGRKGELFTHVDGTDQA